MIDALKKLFENSNSIEDQNSNENLFILSGLMIEAANTDGEISQEEINKISNSLINIFKEEPNEVEKALTEALNNKDNARSLHFYTSKINKNFSDAKKIILIETLWEIILSDNEIHDFESNLLRRLAGLLYVSDIECGNAKKRAENKEYKL